MIWACLPLIVFALGLLAYACFQYDPKDDVDLFVRWLDLKNRKKK